MRHTNALIYELFIRHVPYLHGTGITLQPVVAEINSSVILILCAFAMSVICTVKVPPQITLFCQTQRPFNNIRPVQMLLNVLLSDN